MNRDERIAAIRRTIDNAESRKDELGRVCTDCRYGRDYDYSFASCHSSVAALYGQAGSALRHKIEWPRLTEMRSEVGLCGPEGLLFQSRGLTNLLFWRQPSMGAQFGWAIIAVVLLTATVVTIVTLLVNLA